MRVQIFAKRHLLTPRSERLPHPDSQQADLWGKNAFIHCAYLKLFFLMIARQNDYRLVVLRPQ